MVTNDDIGIAEESPFIDYLEWEWLQKEEKIGKHVPIRTRMLPQGSDFIEVFRDKEYNIRGKLTGIFENRDELVPLEHGKPYKDLKISDLIFKYDIRCSFNDCRYKIDYGRNSRKFESKMFIKHIKRTSDISSKLGCLTEWFLNGKDIGDGVISHKLCKKYNRKINEPTYPNLGCSHKLHMYFLENAETFYQRSSDEKGYIFVEFQDDDEEKYFTIQSVPDCYGPSWSKNISIEYRSDWWMPTPEERKKITEIVSFLMGRQLIKVGYSKYDTKGKIIENCAISPQISDGIHLEDLCKKNVISTPVNTIHGNQWMNNFGVYFKELIPSYFALSDELNLQEVLDKYWLSQALPIEAEIIVMAASLESLLNAWYKSKKSKSKRIYLTEEEFHGIISIYLDPIEKDLGNMELKSFPDFKNRILRKIKNSYQMSVNESYDFFFKEIGLNIGEIEKMAIKYRNKPVHGGKFNKKEYEKLKKMTNAYRTLVNRCILKILNYNLEYIDYFMALDRPIEEYVKHIDEPLGP